MRKIGKANEGQIKNAEAMKCFGNLVTIVNKDPDPKAQDQYCKEFNCANCDYYKYCCKLADTLK